MENRTYFTEVASVNPHFIVAGHTDDLCCNDALQVTSVEYELHRHLKEQGFEAVAFYNPIQNLYCYDRKSFDIIFNRHPDTQTPERNGGADDGINLTSDGPLGEEWDIFSEEEVSNEPEIDEATGTLCNRTLSRSAVWAQLKAMLMGKRKTAVVISNMNEQTGYVFPDEALRTLINLGEYSAYNHSIAVYMFKGLDFAKLEEQTSGAADNWERFMNACIRPLICQANDRSKSGTRHHILRLRYPNAAEIRNLLNSFRLRSRDKLNMHGGDVESVAIKLAYGCSVDSIVLKELISRVEEYIERHPKTPVTPENCHELLGRGNSNTAMDDMKLLIGMDNVKKNLESVFSLAKKEGFDGTHIPPYSSRFTPVNRGVSIGLGLNICLMGEPGTGKSEVADLLGRIFYEAGVLPTAHVESVKPSDIINGDSIGRSGRNMAAYVQSAMGGVLFIDEAYGLSESKAGAAGVEAITQLVGDMTTYKGRFAVVIAGYKDDILNLLGDNEGLRSRFPEENHFYLNPYTWQELRDILLLMAKKDKSEIIFDSVDGEDWLDNFCENWVGDRGLNWGNAREAETLLGSMKQRCAVRTGGEGKTEVNRYRLLPCDVPERLQVHLKPRSRNLDEALEKMENLTGLNTAKRFLKSLCGTIRWDKSIPEPGNYLFVGPPGTGKTFFAEHMAEIFNHMHILRRRTPVICNAGDLKSKCCNTPKHNGDDYLEEIVKSARGGMLFIDEAHQLKDDDTGKAIIRRLVPIIENPEVRADTCIVLAGYQHEMADLLAVDSGLDSRFPKKNHIKFVNYTAAELTSILEDFAKKRGYIPQTGYLKRTRIAMSSFLDTVNHNFGNARYMRNDYLENSIARRTKRLNKENLTYLPDKEREFAVPKEDDVDRVENTNFLESQDIPEDMEGRAGPIDMPEIEEQALDARISDLVGKKRVKDYIEVFRNKSLTPEFFDPVSSGEKHFVITGPSGSGRHTVARVLASMLYEAGMINNERPIYRGKGDFEGRYVGETVPKTRSVINEALGNMLIVENPSNMIQKNESDNTYGVEALATIIGAMSTDDISIVFIDSVDGMESVLKAATGLRERATFFELEDLSPSEMQSIFERSTQYSFDFDDEVKDLLPSFFVNWVSERGGLGEKAKSWANGFELNYLTDELKTNWERFGGDKVQNSMGVPLRCITKDMFPEEMKKHLVSTAANRETVLNDLDNMVGLDEVKQMVHKIRRRILRADKNNVIPGCYCFVGNPGTGKTTVARLMGGVLAATGALSQGHVIERSASKFALKPDLFDEALKLAKNGILFIDEAHQMRETPGGQEVIRKLVYALEDRNVLKNTSIILAGYPEEMHKLLRFDKGLNRRFGNESSIIRFADYTSDELMQIMKEMAKDAGSNSHIGAPCSIELTEEYCRLSKQIFDAVCKDKKNDFGNAGFVRNYLADSVDRLLEREENTEDVEYILTENDIPSKQMKIIENNRKSMPSTLYSSVISTKTVEGLDEEAMHGFSEEYTVYLVIYKDGQKIGVGSGVIISDTGHILTCEHVISEADEVKARVYAPGNIGSKYYWFDCDVLQPVYKDADMALIKMRGENFRYASLRPEDENIKLGEKIFISGFPLGNMLSGGNDESLEMSCFSGTVSSKQNGRVENVFADITGLHGNSGSPVFSMKDGRVIGVFTGSITNKGSLDENNFFRPIHLFWERFTVPAKKEGQG